MAHSDEKLIKSGQINQSGQLKRRFCYFKKGQFGASCIAQSVQWSFSLDQSQYGELLKESLILSSSAAHR